MSLSKLKRIDLRKQWSDEARDFTPWLSSEEGLLILSDLLGLDLEKVETEVYVGNYRADIVAKDSLTDRYIVIENQLTTTDHDHIGKLLTYAASFEAKTIIWIAQQFREEHRQAIDWFNDITSQEVDFFGIELELLQIGDSPYAPNLKIVSKPNEWTRNIRVSKQSVTAGGMKYLDYWEAFNNYIKNNNLDINIRKPFPQHWYDIAIDTSHANLALTLRLRNNDIGTELYISRQNDKDLYTYLSNMKDKMEEIIGTDVEWQLLP